VIEPFGGLRAGSLNDLNRLQHRLAVERFDRVERARGIRFLDRTILRRYKVFMKTLTITDAKKNLGRWLAAAARGEDIGIVCGADIVALRKVDVESTDYAQREYGAIPEQVAALEKATEQRYRRLKQRKKLASITPQELRKMIE
jgi:antitoxin (DNA-binding transcriptional repressor) of toxin-antitoxin stability system